MNGLYILDGADIVVGKKTKIVTPEDRDLAGRRVLVVRDKDGGGLVVGTVVVGDAKAVSVREFDTMDGHGISASDRRRWWPDARKLIVHDVGGFEPLVVPLELTIPSGVGMKMDITMVDLVVVGREERGQETTYTVVKDG